MKPVEFKEQNRIYAKDQPEYLPLPAHVDPNDETVKVISCWELSFSERLKLLFTGKLWVALLTFGAPLTPSYFTVHKNDIFFKDDK